jgi:hypothetical protein
VRVARARKLRPKEIERQVRARIAEHPDLSMKREEVTVGGRSLKAWRSVRYRAARPLRRCTFRSKTGYTRSTSTGRGWTQKARRCSRV